jgi:hypothetical protein
MNTDLSLQSLLVIRRGLNYYDEYLSGKMANPTDMDVASLKDEAEETKHVIERVNEIYAQQHEQEYGEPPSP